MNRSAFFLSLLIVLVGGATLCVAQGASSPVDFLPGPDLQKRYLSPSPAEGATKKSRQSTIGSGKAMIDSGDPKDPFWNEPVDLDGAGHIVNADMLWDESSKILYVFARASLRCTHGKSIDGAVLIGIYGKKNFLDKSPGSGWWVVDLAKDECEAPLAGLYGCKFDSYGSTLACGRAALDRRINDIAIVESTQF